MRSASKIAPSPLGLKAISGALEGAKVARAKQLAGLRPRQKSEDKSDLVTEGDEAAQEAILAVLPCTNKDETIGVLAEEKMAPKFHAQHAVWRWVIDPVDGTLPYSRSEPYWSTSVALQQKREEWESRIGVVYQASPKDTAETLSGRIFYAEEGNGAFTYAPETGNLWPIARPSPIAPIAEFSASGALNALARREFEKRNITTAFRRSICHAACELFIGEKCAVIQDAGPLEWDIAAITLIAREAGASVSTRKVEPIKECNRYAIIMCWDKTLFEILQPL